MKKKFLITIDTEGDNLWKWRIGDNITTNNACYLDRFQILCEKYGFIPTYLTNYEMAVSEQYQSFVKPHLKDASCEIGLHIHAWNNPPYFELLNTTDNPGQAFITEYPEAIIEEKTCYLLQKMKDIFEVPIVTHRAGRWATNDTYFNILAKYGIKVDCSITPHIDWSKNRGETEGSKGSDYSLQPENPFYISTQNGDVLEIPVTVRNTRRFFWPSESNIKKFGRSVYHAFDTKTVWLRPNGHNLNEMMWLLEYIKNENTTDYIMFMLHSSELMPGGSPNFVNEEAIEKLYSDIERIFAMASRSYVGSQMKDYCL